MIGSSNRAVWPWCSERRGAVSGVLAESITNLILIERHTEATFDPINASVLLLQLGKSKVRFCPGARVTNL